MYITEPEKRFQKKEGGWKWVSKEKQYFKENTVSGKLF